MICKDEYSLCSGTISCYSQQMGHQGHKSWVDRGRLPVPCLGFKIKKGCNLTIQSGNSAAFPHLEDGDTQPVSLHKAIFKSMKSGQNRACHSFTEASGHSSVGNYTLLDITHSLKDPGPMPAQEVVTSGNNDGSFLRLWGRTKQNKNMALARWLSCLEYPSLHQNVVGLIPGQGTYLSCRFDPQ